MKEPITPGEILLEEYLKPMGISQNAMARAIGVSPRAINEIVLGRRSITPPMSIRFGAFFGQSDKFWHGIQVECGLSQAGRGQDPTDCRHSTRYGGRSPERRPPRRSTRAKFWSTVTKGRHKDRCYKNFPQRIDASVCAALARRS